MARRSAQGAAPGSSGPESPLKLPERAVLSDDEVIEPPRPLPPAIKLPGKPVNPAAPSSAVKLAEIVGKPQEFIGEAPEVELAPDDSRELPSFQLQYQGTKRRDRPGRRIWVEAAIALATLLVGYSLGGGGAGPSARSARGVDTSSLTAPTGAEQRELDAAFMALRSPRHAEAQQMFAALLKKHPQWQSLHTQIALAALYANDAAAFEKLINQGESSGVISPADGQSLLGQRSMDIKEFEDASRYLGQAVGADPARADSYYFWGDCLLRSGHPNEAVEKFRAARLRNPNPTIDNVYLSKLWLAEIESGLETTDGTAAQIDRALAVEHPTSSALFARAARAVKAGQFGQAVEALTRAREISDPATFRVLLQAPSFYEEHWRPGFEAFYGSASTAQPPTRSSPVGAPAVGSPR